MNTVDVNEVLNQLHALHRYSLAMYLNDAKPWPIQGDEAAREVLHHIVVDQQQTADRLADLILENDGDVQGSEYPMYFTGYNDLTMKYMLTQLIAHQKRDIVTMEDCVKLLDAAPFAKAVVEESLGAAIGHLDSLVELTQPAQEQSGTAS